MRQIPLTVFLLACGSGAPRPTEGNINGVVVSCTADGLCSLDINATFKEASGTPVQEGIVASSLIIESPGIASQDDDLDLAVESAVVTDLTYEVIDAEGVSLPLLIDKSCSMDSNDPDEQSLAAARSLLDVLLAEEGESHEAAVMTFPRTSSLGDLEDTDIWQDFTADTGLLDEALTALSGWNSGGTPLNDSMIEVISYQDAALDSSRARALVVLTDGGDSESWADVEEVIVAAQAARTPLYVAGLGESVDFEELQLMATQTGGLFIPAADAEQLTETFTNLSQALYGSVTIQAEMRLSENSEPIAEGWYQLSGSVVWDESITMSLDTVVYITDIEDL